MCLCFYRHIQDTLTHSHSHTDRQTHIHRDGHTRTQTLTEANTETHTYIYKTFTQEHTVCLALMDNKKNMSLITKCIGEVDTFSNTALHQDYCVLSKSQYGYH